MLKLGMSSLTTAPDSGSNPVPELSYRAGLLQRATPRIPLTAEGLLVGFYRVDLLPFARAQSQSQAEAQAEEASALRNAYVDLSYEYGYPTLASGSPFWYKLDFEPSFAFASFQAYLELINEGPREISKLASNPELLHVGGALALANGTSASTSTSATATATATATGSEPSFTSAHLQRQLYEYSILYCWRQRAKAYDLYKEAAYRHMRLKRQINIEDSHYQLACNLLATLKERVLNTPAFWEVLSTSPKASIDFLSKLVAIQRVSVGLPASGPLPTKETPEDMTFEMIMRSLGTKQAQGDSAGAGGGGYGGAASSGRSALQTVLEDPDTARQLQEVIIRVTRSQTQARSDQASADTSPSPSQSQSQGRVFKTRRRQEFTITDEDLIVDVPGDLIPESTSPTSPTSPKP